MITMIVNDINSVLNKYDKMLAEATRNVILLTTNNEELLTKISSLENENQELREENLHLRGGIINTQENQ